MSAETPSTKNEASEKLQTPSPRRCLWRSARGDSVRRNLRRSLSACWILLGLALLVTARTAVAVDVWGDNGSIPIGGGNNGGPGGPGPGPDPGPHDGEPVAIYTGQYTLTADDVNIAGRMPLRVRRLYRSGANYQGMFGRGWNMELNERIYVLATNGNLMLRRNDITKDEFANLGTGAYSPPVGVFDQLVRNLDGTYTIRDKNGGIRQYNVNGCLTEVRDRNGNQLLLSYDPGGKEPINAISDYSHFTNAILVARDFRLTRIEVAFNYALSGRYLQFYYDGNGRVTNVTDFASRSWTYAYDPSGNGTLLSVTTPPASGYPAGLVTRYTYNATNHLIQTVTDQSGNALLANAYDSQGRIIQQTWGTATWNFAYPNTTDRWITNGNGYRIYRLFDTNGLMIERRDYTAGLRPSDPAYFSTKYSYTNLNQPGKVIFPGGNVTSGRFDVFGNQLQTRLKAADVADSGQDIVTSATYEPVYNLLKTYTDARGYTITNVYDYEIPSIGATNGNRVRVLLPPTAAGAGVLSWSYTAYGDVDSFTNTIGSVTKYAYDANGYVLQRIDGYGSPAAATNSFTVDNRGNSLTATDPRGNTTTYQYDALDRQTQATRPAPFGYITRYSYTGNGRLADVESQTSDGTHPYETNALTYDLLDRTSTLVDGAGHVTRFFYDGAGNQTNTLDANGNTIVNLFDERKLLWKVIDAQSNTTTYAYTLNGKLAWAADARSNLVSYAYDAYDRLTNVSYPDATFEAYVFDPNGNVLAQRSRTGLWNTNSYDTANNLIQRIRSDGTVANYQFDLASRQVQGSDLNGTASYSYDALSRMTVATNTASQRVAYQYDRAGNRTRLIDPESVFIDYAYDSLNRVTNITYAGTNVVALYTYDALGRSTQTDFGNGIRQTTGYDWANLVTNLAYTVTNSGTVLARQAHAYDNAGNRLSIQAIGSAYPGLHSYAYDRKYQLTQVSYPPSYPFANSVYNYDAMGNRTNANEGASVNYGVNNLNQYSSVGGSAYAYSANGNLATDAVGTYNYDNDNRLTAALRGGNSGTYTYDASGSRIRKVVNGVTRNFLYDVSGQIPMLLGEYDGGGAPVVKYVFNTTIPVAMAASGTVYSCHCDQLSRPILLTDRTGALVWQANYAAFGQAAVVPGNTASINLRAAGQYEDAETGLFYNLARYYNPRIGRYQSFDPAMEAASPLFAQVQGANAYAYVGNNCVNAADPNGNISIFFIVCSGPLPVCSLSLFCSGQVIVGACSAGLVCSGQAGVASACSASVIACSGQGGAYGAAACSGNIVGACSGQAAYGGIGACSGQVAGACSGQAGVVGGSACSANGAGACSAQLGAGASACSAQGAGACSVQVGPGASGCSAQGAGACSAQPDFPGPFGCSAQGAGTCSASTASGCHPKHAGLWRQAAEGDSLYASADGASRKWVTGLCLERAASGTVELRFIAHGYARFETLAAEPGSTRWVPVGSGAVANNQVTLFQTAGSANGAALQVKLRLKGAAGESEELGPFALAASSTAEMAALKKPGHSPWLFGLLGLLTCSFCGTVLVNKLD